MTPDGDGPFGFGIIPLGGDNPQGNPGEDVDREEVIEDLITLEEDISLIFQSVRDRRERAMDGGDLPDADYLQRVAKDLRVTAEEAEELRVELSEEPEDLL